MSDASQADENVQVDVHEEREGVRTLEVEVRAERVGAAFEQAWQQLARRVRVRGFRPGKTPRSVLRKLYGASVAEELERTLVAQTLPVALTRSGLEPVSEPAVDAAPPTEDAAFRYRARVEVKPEIRLPDLSGLHARRPPVEVAEEDVERELERLRQAHAVLVEEPEDTAAARGHVLTIHFEGRVDGEPFEGGSGDQEALELGSGHFLPGFEEQLEGVGAGGRRTVRVEFPEDHPKPELAGKKAEFEVEVRAVRRREVPALDDELARDVGDFDSLDALRAEVRRRIASALERQSRAVVRRTLLDDLIGRTPFEVPPGAAAQRLQRRLAMARREMAGRGLPGPALEAQLARGEEEWRPEAEREVREQWLLEAVAREHGLEAEPAEVEERLEALAREEGVPAARLRRAYGEAGLLEGLGARVREDKAVEFLLRTAKVEETTGT